MRRVLPLRRLLLAGIALGLFFAVVLQRHAIASYDWRLSWRPFVTAVCVFSIGPFVGAAAFWVVLRDLAPGARVLPALCVWMRSFAARYVPFGALTVTVRVVERGRLDASRAQMLSATGFEMLIAAAGAAAVSLAAFAVAGRGPPLVAALALAAVLALATGALPALRWLSRRRAALNLSVLPVVRFRCLAAAISLSVCNWLVAGAATWLLVDSLSETAPPGFFFLLGSYAFAWLIGFVVVFAPSGLGAREVTLVALLAPTFGAGPATALALALRLANLAGDFVAIGAVEGVSLLVRRLGRPGPIAMPGGSAR